MVFFILLFAGKVGDTCKKNCNFFHFVQKKILFLLGLGVQKKKKIRVCIFQYFIKWIFALVATFPLFQNGRFVTQKGPLSSLMLIVWSPKKFLFCIYAFFVLKQQVGAHGFAVSNRVETSHLFLRVSPISKIVGERKKKTPHRNNKKKNVGEKEKVAI